jgi:hypothetical protein
MSNPPYSRDGLRSISQVLIGPETVVLDEVGAGLEVYGTGVAVFPGLQAANNRMTTILNPRIRVFILFSPAMVFPRII